MLLCLNFEIINCFFCPNHDEIVTVTTACSSFILYCVAHGVARHDRQLKVMVGHGNVHDWPGSRFGHDLKTSQAFGFVVGMAYGHG